MEEENKLSDEFDFSFEVSPEFYENFTSHIAIQYLKIQNNVLWPSYLKAIKLQELENSYKERLNPAEKPMPLPITPLNPTISSILSKKVFVDTLYIDLNQEKIDIDTNKTKSMILSDLSNSSESKNFLFILNKEWVQMKELQKEKEMSSSIQSVYFRKLIKKFRNEDWWVEKEKDHEIIYKEEDIMNKILEKIQRDEELLFAEDY